jgi:hypothetical protein
MAQLQTGQVAPKQGESLAEVRSRSLRTQQRAESQCQTPVRVGWLQPVGLWSFHMAVLLNGTMDDLQDLTSMLGSFSLVIGS